MSWYVERDRKVVLKAFIRLLKPGGLLSIVKHNEVGRVLQTVVFENDPQKALDLLAGQDWKPTPWVWLQAYDLDSSSRKSALESQDYQGSVSFMPCRTIASKGQEGWRESMLKMELAVCQESLIGISPSSSTIG